VFAELPVGSQSSRAQTSYGLCLGVLACIDKPIIQLTPNDIKMHIGGKKTPPKIPSLSGQYLNTRMLAGLRRRLKVK
jgi:hypothetical protein